MLTAQEKRQQSIELNENYQALSFPREQILKDIQISEAELDAVLAMDNENPTKTGATQRLLLSTECSLSL